MKILENAIEEMLSEIGKELKLPRELPIELRNKIIEGYQGVFQFGVLLLWKFLLNNPPNFSKGDFDSIDKMMCKTEENLRNFKVAKPPTRFYN